MTGPVRRSRACEALAEQRSALVDGALADADRERVLAHLVDCPECRQEVAELRRLRRLLNDPTGPATAPSYDLADRLVAIAGDDAREPLLATPFRAGGSGRLRRRRRIGKAAAGAGTVGAAALLVVVVGLAAAPAEAGMVTDPTAGAQAEFGALTAQLPLADSVGRVLLSDGQAHAGATMISPGQPLGPPARLDDQRQLTTTGAIEELRRAAAADGEVSFSGTQRVQVRVDGGVLSADYTVQTRLGNPRMVVVYDTHGRAVSAVATSVGSRVTDPDELGLLRRNYLLVGTTGALVAGQRATLVSAIGQDGRTAARWWIDTRSGLLLWHEVYDESGRTALSAGFTRIRIGGPDATGGGVEAPASVPVTSTTLTFGHLDRLSAAGWTCPERLGALSLIRLRADSTITPTVLHLAYTDGVSSVSVFEQRGSLAGAPDGTRWDKDLGAYVRGGPATIATWESGGTVFTVVTDGSDELLANAVHALPHGVVAPRTTIERVRAGWSRILESVTG